MATFESVALAEKIASSKPLFRADDQSIALRIRYTGSSATGTVECDATGDLLFVEGAAADASIVIGSTAGTIDVSNASGNTLGEVVDHINADPNWEAVIVDGLRADSVDGVLLDEGPTDCTGDDGADFHWDTDETFDATVSFQNEDLPSKNKDDAGYINRVYYINGKSTYASGTSTIKMYKCVGTTETLVWSQAAAATTVEKEIDLTAGGLGVDGGVGGRFVVRIDNSAAAASTALTVLGKTYVVV